MVCFGLEYCFSDRHLGVGGTRQKSVLCAQQFLGSCGVAKQLTFLDCRKVFVLQVTVPAEDYCP